MDLSQRIKFYKIKYLRLFQYCNNVLIELYWYILLLKDLKMAQANMISDVFLDKHSRGNKILPIHGITPVRLLPEMYR